MFVGTKSGGWKWNSCFGARLAQSAAASESIAKLGNFDVRIGTDE